MNHVEILTEAVDGMESRLDEVLAFLRELEEGGPPERQRLAHVMHQCANVQQSMGALRRIVKRL